MDISAFRANFPEFTSVVDYPDSLLNFWAVVAEGLVDDERWGTLRENARGLALAHHVALAKQSAISGAGGAVPGIDSGNVTQKSVGDVSISYAPNNASSGGQFGKTTYGQQYLALTQIFGAGAAQLC